mgnify:FL=1
MSKKDLKELKELQKLNNELDDKNTDLEKLILNHKSSNEDINLIMEDIEKIQQKISKYNSFYPSIYNNDLAKQLFNKNDFNIYKINNKDKSIEELLKEFKNLKTTKKHSRNKSSGKHKKTSSKKELELSNTQLLLKNFMSPYSPYRSLLIFHGTGVGKTCTGITIAENLKQITSDNNQKIFIIRYEEFKSQILDIKNLRNNTLNKICTKNTYVK